MCQAMRIGVFLALAAVGWGAGIPAYNIQTVAGSDFSSSGVSALAAIFSQPEGIAVDNGGNIYIADADGNRVSKINPGGSIQAVAGNGTAGFAGDGGPAGAALLSHPYGVAADAQGNVYVADLGNARVRKISPDGTIRTIAGGGSIAPGGNGDGGPATNALLLEPRNIAVDPDGTLYVSDFGAHRVYRVSSAGILTTLAGTGSAGFSGDDGAGQLAQLNSPAGLASDSNGSLYIADSSNNRVRRLYLGVITTVDKVVEPTGVAIGPDGTLYIAAGYLGTPFKAIGGIASAYDVAVDRLGTVYATSGQYVRKVTSDGTVTTIAGSGAAPYFGGDNGLGAAARLHWPSGLAVDQNGNWYIADTFNNRIRKINSAGMITTIAGTGVAGATGDNGPATLAELKNPRSVAVDSQNNIYIADSGNNSVRKIGPNGIVATLGGLQLNDPEYVAVDSNGSLYIADSGNGRVIKVTSLGAVSIVMLIQRPSSIALDGSGSVYVTGATSVSRIAPDGSLTTVLGGLTSPRGLAVTPNGDVLVADTSLNAVRKLSSTGVLSTIAGTGVAGFSGDGQPAVAAQLNSPADLVVGSAGTIWIADSGNNRIRTLSPSVVVAEVLPSATVVHGATLAPGPIAPGEIITIFGTGFDPKQTQLVFGNEVAAMFYTSANQINALAPLDLVPNSTTDISIVVNGSKTADVFSQIVSAAPGIFTMTGIGTGQAAAVNQDGTLNSEANPAARGSIVSLYATGQGQNAGAVSLKIGLYPAPLFYTGPAPGFPGLMQINAQVPAGFLPPGIQPVALAVGSATSQDGVTIAVR